MTRMTKRIIELRTSDYLRIDAVTFKLKINYDDSKCWSATNELGKPFWVNHRVDVEWGYCDDWGMVWEVKWI